MKFKSVCCKQIQPPFKNKSQLHRNGSEIQNPFTNDMPHCTVSSLERSTVRVHPSLRHKGEPRGRRIAERLTALNQTKTLLHLVVLFNDLFVSKKIN